jgi:6-phosphogluconolactonase
MFKSQARVSPPNKPCHMQLTTSAPGLVFWFADAEASSATTYPPTTFRWIDNQKEAEEAVDAAKKKAARREAGEE